MKRYLIVWSILLSTNILLGQSKVIGNVYFQNSQSQPAADIHIISKGSNNDYSKSDGSYHLVFQEKQRGDYFYISVSTTDGKGKEIVLVNKEAISQFRIPSNPEDRFPIIVAYKEDYEIRKKSYIKKLLKYKTTELRKLRSELTHKNKESKVKEEERSILFEKIALLEKDLIDKESELAEQAAFFTEINLDNASNMVLTALDIMNQSEDVDKVLQVLDRDGLYNSQKKVLNSLKKKEGKGHELLNTLEALYDANEIRKNLLLSVNRFSDAILCMEAQIQIRERNITDSLILAEHYDEISNILEKIGRYKESKGYALKQKKLVKGNLRLELYCLSADEQLYNLNYALANFKDEDEYQNLKREIYAKYSKTLRSNYWIERALLAGFDSTELYVMYDLLGDFSSVDNKQELLPLLCDQYEIAMKITSLTNSIKLDSLYILFLCEREENNILLNKISKYIKNAPLVTISDKMTILSAYQLQYYIYAENDNVKDFLATVQKAIELRESFSTEKDVEELVDMYLVFAIGYIHSNLEIDTITKLCYENFNKAVEIQLSQLSPFHLDISKTYLAFAEFEVYIGEYDHAINLVNKSIEIKKTHLSEISNQLFKDYHLIGIIASDKGDLQLYEDCLEKQFQLAKLYFNPEEDILYNLYLDQFSHYLENEKYEKAFQSIMQREIFIESTIKRFNHDSIKEKYIDYHSSLNYKKAELFIRWGKLKEGKKLWKRYKNKHKPTSTYSFRIDLHIALLENNKNDAKILIGDENSILGFNIGLHAFPESKPLFRKMFPTYQKE